MEWKYAIRVNNNKTFISVTIAYMLAVLEVILPEAQLYASVSAGTSLISGPGKRICDVFATSRPERFSQRTPFQSLMGLSFNPWAYNNTPVEKKNAQKRSFSGFRTQREELSSYFFIFILYLLRNKMICICQSSARND